MFSELVDRATNIVGRPQDYELFAYFANETMRDISKHSDWDDDTMEEQVLVSSNQPATIWKPAGNISHFRRAEFIVDGCGCSPIRVTPDRRMTHRRSFYYYRSSDCFVFVNACDPIRIYYYRYQPWLIYYPANQRPTAYDFSDDEWAVQTDEARAKVSNWMLERHNLLVLQGTLAFYFAHKQDPRQATH